MRCYIGTFCQASVKGQVPNTRAKPPGDPWLTQGHLAILVYLQTMHPSVPCTVPHSSVPFCALWYRSGHTGSYGLHSCKLKSMGTTAVAHRAIS